MLRDPTLHAAAGGVARFFAEAGPEDTLLLHIAGHGVRNDKGRLFFAVEDTQPGELFHTALAAPDVAGEMESSAARRIVVLLDCCYAGAFDETPALMIASPFVPKPLGTAAGRMPRDGRGHVVIAAATSVQQAIEGNTGGIFTRCVVHGLATGAADLNGDGVVDTHELFLHVAERMRELGATASQQPTYTAHNVIGLLRVATRPGAEVPQVVEVPPARPAPPPVRGKSRGQWAQLAAPAAAALLFAGCAVQADSRVADGGCPAPARVRVAADPAGLAASRQLAEAFEDWVARGRHGCRTADLYVYPVPGATMADGLRTGWGTDENGRAYLAEVGPHPDLWLPGADSDLPPPGDDPIHTVRQVAETPIVLGVPARVKLPAGQRAEKSWPELFALARKAGGVVRADPADSAVALMATTKLYDDGTVGATTARDQIERPIEQAADAGRFPLDSETDLLCRQGRLRGRTSLVLTEQQLVRFNQGSSPCLEAVAAPGPQDRLIAYYPELTPKVAKSVVTLHWPLRVQSTRVQEVADWFARWLVQPDGRAELLRAGLRPTGIAIGAPLTGALGADPDWPFSRIAEPEPAAATRRKITASYEAARRAGRFLVALDASGSMDTVTADPTRTRWESALAAVERAAGRLGGRDRLGLMTFAGESVREVLPVAPRGARAPSQVRAAVAPVTPQGGTPLYAAIARGTDILRAGSGRDDLRALVVLTDGRDSSGRPPPAVSRSAGVRVFVIATGDVSCAGAKLDRLAAGTGGRCFDAGQDSPESVLTGMFRAVWG